MWVKSLGQEDPLEEDMANHSSMLAWEIPWKEEPGGLWSMGLQRDGHDWGNLACTYKVLLNLFFYFIFFFSLFHLSAIQGKTSMAPGFEAKKWRLRMLVKGKKEPGELDYEKWESGSQSRIQLTRESLRSLMLAVDVFPFWSLEPFCTLQCFPHIMSRSSGMIPFNFIAAKRENQ